MTLESPSMGERTNIHSEHSGNIAYFRRDIHVEMLCLKHSANLG